jgi:hypothetical protein
VEPLAGVRVFPELVQVAVSKSDVDVARARAGCIASLDMPPRSTLPRSTTPITPFQGQVPGVLQKGGVVRVEARAIDEAGCSMSPTRAVTCQA